MLLCKAESKQLNIDMKKSYTTYENYNNIMLIPKLGSIVLV